MEEIKKVIESYNKVKGALDDFERSIARVDVEGLKPAGREFVELMAHCHRHMSHTHEGYQSDIIEAEASLEPRLETYALHPGLEISGASI